MGQTISLYSSMPHEAKLDMLENQVQQKEAISKKVYDVASEVESFRIKHSYSTWSDNEEKCASLTQRVKALGQSELTPPAQKTIKAAQQTLAHLSFGLENPIVFDLEKDSAFPNFALNLQDTAAKIKTSDESEKLKIFRQELDPIQQKEVKKLVPKGNLSKEALANGIESYLDSLQEQALKAETLYLKGDPKSAQSILDSMEKRMGL